MLAQKNPHQQMDSRDGFTKGDQVKRKGGNGDLPADGVVNGWSTYEYGPADQWYCCVTWGGRYIGRYQADELEHATTAS
ncbi:hypothetical protein [Streptomyces sp. SD31]|uniref:hypothetical protein n=1 Tax=Streptomyces sp. SD31 TaxID=3452208 RepID=UPI003F8B84AD